jgi:hypothetical protein
MEQYFHTLLSNMAWWHVPTVPTASVVSTTSYTITKQCKAIHGWIVAFICKSVGLSREGACLSFRHDKTMKKGCDDVDDKQNCEKQQISRADFVFWRRPKIAIEPIYCCHTPTGAISIGGETNGSETKDEIGLRREVSKWGRKWCARTEFPKKQRDLIGFLP